MIRNTVTAEEIESPFEPQSAIGACSAKVFPTEEIESVKKITGANIFLPKTPKKLAFRDLATVSATEGGE